MPKGTLLHQFEKEKKNKFLAAMVTIQGKKSVCTLPSVPRKWSESFGPNWHESPNDPWNGQNWKLLFTVFGCFLVIWVPRIKIHEYHTWDSLGHETRISKFRPAPEAICRCQKPHNSASSKTKNIRMRLPWWLSMVRNRREPSHRYPKNGVNVLGHNGRNWRLIHGFLIFLGYLGSRNKNNPRKF